jgi:hypothetical protein
VIRIVPLAILFLGAFVSAGWSQKEAKPGSFSDMAVEPATLAPGGEATVKATLHNDSGQDWAAQTCGIYVVVGQGKKTLRKTQTAYIKKAIPAGGSKEVSLRVSLPQSASGEVGFYFMAREGGKLVARSAALPVQVSGASAPASSAPAEKASVKTGGAASFSDMALVSQAVSAGTNATVKALVHNDSSEDWPAMTRRVFVAVGQGKKVLRKTQAAYIKKAIPAGGSKELSIRVSVPDDAAGDVDFYLFVSLGPKVLARSEPLRASLGGGAPAPVPAAVNRTQPAKAASAAAAPAPEPVYHPSTRRSGSKDRDAMVEDQMQQLSSDGQ